MKHIVLLILVTIFLRCTDHHHNADTTKPNIQLWNSLPDELSFSVGTLILKGFFSDETSMHSAEITIKKENLTILFTKEYEVHDELLYSFDESISLNDVKIGESINVEINVEDHGGNKSELTKTILIK